MEVLKKDVISIETIFSSLKLGEIIDIKKIQSSQNEVFRVDTPNKKYLLKKYSKDAIKNDYELNKRKRQIAISEKFKENGVPTILPLSFNGKYFIHYRSIYYLLYEYYDYEPITHDKVTSKNIKKLANTLAIMHKINIKVELPCQYKKVNIDFNKYLKKFSKLDDKLYRILYDNYFVLENLAENCNENIKYVKNHLCASHNDYKLENIIWNKDFMYLVDYDACSMSNPLVSLAESSFEICQHNNTIDKAAYKEFIKTYIKKYGSISSDYKIALNVAMNGKLQWLEYLMSKCSKKNQNAIKDTINMIKTLTLFANNITEFNDIFLTTVKR